MFFILFNYLYYFLIFFLFNAAVCIQIDSWFIWAISIHYISIISNCLIQYFILSFIVFYFKLMIYLLLQRETVVDIKIYHVPFQLHSFNYFTILRNSTISDIWLNISSFVLLTAWINEGKSLLILWGIH